MITTNVPELKERVVSDAGATIRVLIADDNQADMTLLQRAIRSGFDMTVVGAALDGIDAVSKSVNRSPAVVVMDAHMPRMNGLDATGRIKALLPEVKVLILGTSPSDLAQAWAHGADAYLWKDRAAGDLLTKVRALAAGKAKSPPNALSVVR